MPPNLPNPTGSPNAPFSGHASQRVRRSPPGHEVKSHVRPIRPTGDRRPDRRGDLPALRAFATFPTTRSASSRSASAAAARSSRGLIALDGEAGFQPQLLRGGLHYLLPLQYRVHVLPLVTIPQGKIGYVFARDGQPLPPSQTLAVEREGRRLPGRRRVPAQRRPARPAAQDPARGHLRDQPRAVRRPHRGARLLRCRSTRREEQLFQRMAQDHRASASGFAPVVIKGADDVIGIVTVHDGPSLPPGEIIAPTVGDDPANAAHVPQQLPGPRDASSPPAACAAASSRCWSRARTTSTACSRPSR